MLATSAPVRSPPALREAIRPASPWSSPLEGPAPPARVLPETVKSTAPAPRPEPIALVTPDGPPLADAAAAGSTATKTWRPDCRTADRSRPASTSAVACGST